MEKYYITRVAELEPGGLGAVSRLLEVQFLRRPPTIGLLFTSQSSQNNCSCVKLATLSLNNENKAKFANTSREVSLTGVGAPLVSLDTYNRGQLLVEGSHSSGGSSTSKAFEHLMSSSVFALSQTGQILAVSMIRRDSDNSSPSELLKECKLSNPQVAAQNKFLQLQVQDSAGQQADRVFHVLSQRCYLAYSVRLKRPPPGGAPAAAAHGSPPARYLDLCELVLEQEYSNLASANLLQPVELSRMLPLDSRGSVLLESSDNSLRVIRQSQCIWTIQAPSGSQGLGPRQSLLLLQSREAASGARDEPDNILLSLTSSNQLVAHSLSISARQSAAGGRGPIIDTKDLRKGGDLFEMLNEGGDLSDAPEGHRDPDKLLPQAPSFELDECWSIELSQLLDSVSGLSSALESNDDDEDSTSGRQTGGGYLCAPLWLPQGSAAAAGEDESTRRWPQFLLLFHKVHVLIFSFEQENSLPFSVVYDRAFMNLTGGSESSDQPTNKIEPQVKRVDLRARPRLLHNIKLVGTQPSDCLFNLIFLSSSSSGGGGGGGGSKRPPAHISRARHFNQLGLMAAITSEGHVLAFKLTSPQVVDATRKDNLYQQVLLDSLRDESLLRDELDRLQAIGSQLRKDTAKLESALEGSGHTGGSTESDGTSLVSSTRMLTSGGQGHLFELSHSGGQAIQVRLEHHALVGGLYELSVEWPGSQVCVVKVVVFSTVEGCEILPPSAGGNSLIENIQISGEKTGELGPFRQHGDSTQSAMAVLELKSRGDELPAAGENAQRVQVPLFLQDGQKGLVKVFVIFFEKSHALQATDVNNHQLLSMKSSKFDYLQREPEVPYAASHSGMGQLQFILNELPVKPLVSYRLLAHHEDAHTNHMPAQQQMDTLEASGPFGGEQLLAWLDELFDMTPGGDNSASSSSLRFESNLTGCSIEVKIEQTSTSNGQSHRMLVTSQDADALGLIKKHTLKRATDSSIKLNIQQSASRDKRVAHAVDKHREKNSELVESVKRAAGKASLKTRASRDDQSRLTPAQKDMLLDNLLGEIDRIDLDGLVDHSPFGQATGELMKSSNFLERSLRQDIEQLFGSGD